MSKTTDSNAAQEAVARNFPLLQAQLPALLTVTEVARILNISRPTVDRWVAQRIFPAPFKLGGAVLRFSRDTVLQFIARQQTIAPMAARSRNAQAKTRRAAR